MKKLLITLMALTAFGTAAQAKTIEITLDSPVIYTMAESAIEKSELEAAAYISNDITMVPLRFVSENLGANVDWNGEARQVTCTKGNKTIILTIDDINAQVTTGEGTSSNTLLSAPVIVNDRTFVPLRFVSENFDAYVEYVAPTRQVIITDEPAALTVNGKRLDTAFLDTYYKMNEAYIGYYGPEAYFSAVYQNLLDMTAFESNWSVLDPDTSLPEEYMAELNGFNSDELAEQGILKSYLTKIYIADNAITKAQNMMAGSFTEEQMFDFYDNTFVCAKHILFSTVNNETGESLSDKEKEAVKKKAEGILAKIKKGEDFDKLMKENTEDPGSEYYPEGYVFTGGEMVPEFEEAVFNIGDNELSGIVESDYGYHIIKRVPLPEMDEETKTKVENALINNFMQDLISNASVIEGISYGELYNMLTPEEYKGQPVG